MRRFTGLDMGKMTYAATVIVCRRARWNRLLKDTIGPIDFDKVYHRKRVATNIRHLMRLRRQFWPHFVRHGLNYS